MSAKTPAAIIFDETGTHAAAVKPASTAAVATDKAMVATLSPNGNQLTDAQLRATAVPVSAASLPLPTGAATAALQTQPGVDIGDVTVNNGAGAAAVNIQDGGNSITVDATSLPLPTGAATEATLALVKAKTDNLDVALSTRASQATVATLLTEADFDARVGNVSASPTANTILGRLKDLYDRFVAQLPAALVGGRLDANIGAWLGSTAPTVGQKNMASSVPVTMASNQSPIPVSFTQAGSRDGVSAGKVTLGGSTAGTLQIMRSTTYIEQAAAAQRSIASSSANDSSAGTGARTVEITYYDASGAGPFTTTVTLNGTTAVALGVSDLRFVEKMEVKTVGSAATNVGTITLYVNNTGGGGVIGSIGVGNILTGAGDGSTLWAHHYTAVGYTAHFSVLATGIISGGSGTNGQFFLKKRLPLVSDGAESLIGDVVLAIGAYERTFTFTPQFTGFSQVTAYCIPGTNNATATASFDWSEVAS